MAMMSTFAHHGIIYVPLGYASAFGLLTDLSEARGGSGWGAGTFAVSYTFRCGGEKSTELRDRPEMDLASQQPRSSRLPTSRVAPSLSR